MSDPKWTHLERAPIHEAVIDFRVQLPEGVDSSRLLELHSKIKERYPKLEERRAFKGQIEIRQGRPVGTGAMDLGVNGYFFKNEEATQVVQFRLDGFAFSRLKPYQHWKSFRDEAERLWEVYKGLAPSVARVAVRYINHIDLPVPVMRLEDYFNFSPRWPAEERFHGSAFLSRVEVVEPPSQARAILTQALLPPKGQTALTVLLDIDVFKELPFDLDYKAAWQTVDQFQAMKNDLFFGMITEKTRELCA